MITFADFSVASPFLDSPTPNVVSTTRRRGQAEPRTARTFVVPLRVRVNSSDGPGEQIKALLTRLGGIPSLSSTRPYYDFVTDLDRDIALNAVRSLFGWTSVDPM